MDVGIQAISHCRTYFKRFGRRRRDGDGRAAAGIARETTFADRCGRQCRRCVTRGAGQSEAVPSGSTGTGRVADRRTLSAARRTHGSRGFRPCSCCCCCRFRLWCYWHPTPPSAVRGSFGRRGGCRGRRAPFLRCAAVSSRRSAVVTRRPGRGCWQCVLSDLRAQKLLSVNRFTNFPMKKKTKKKYRQTVLYSKTRYTRYSTKKSHKIFF